MLSRTHTHKHTVGTLMQCAYIHACKYIYIHTYACVYIEAGRQHYFWIISAKSKVRLILYAFTSCIRRVLFFAGSFCGAGTNNTHTYAHKSISACECPAIHTYINVYMYIYIRIYKYSSVYWVTQRSPSAALSLCWPKAAQMTAALTRCPAWMHAHAHTHTTTRTTALVCTHTQAH